jgi:hypothetical protein
MPDAATAPGFEWREAGDRQSNMVLVGETGPVAIVGMYNWVARLGRDELLFWHQRRGRHQPIRFSVVRPAELRPLTGDIVAQCPERGDEPAIVLGGRPRVEFELATTVADEDLSASFPEPVRQLEELVCAGPVWPLSLLVAHPTASTYRLHSQEWFCDETGFDLGYQWVTRVARDPVTGKIWGDGIRIAPFVLDDSLRLTRMRMGD